MPPDYVKLNYQIVKMGEQGKSDLIKLSNLHSEASKFFREFTSSDIQEKLSKIIARDSGIRCALPFETSFNSSFDPPSASDQSVIVLAGDGSSIPPSHHEPVLYGVINTGIIKHKSGSKIEHFIDTKLLYSEQLYTTNGSLIPESVIGLIRNVRERQMLLDMALQETNQSICLIDGPIEIYRESGQLDDTKAYFEDYLNVLNQLCERKAILAGYIDQPAANLVVRMLELYLLPDAYINTPRDCKPFGRLTDKSLFNFLRSGQRSSIFYLHSTTSKLYGGLYFFYLNVSNDQDQYIVRVEIPGWVARNQTMVNDLHSSLLAQCKILGKKPYPYTLIRAHEIAVLTAQDRAQIREMIIHEFMKRGLFVRGFSNKQYLKDIL